MKKLKFVEIGRNIEKTSMSISKIFKKDELEKVKGGLFVCDTLTGSCSGYKDDCNTFTGSCYKFTGSCTTFKDKTN